MNICQYSSWRLSSETPGWNETNKEAAPSYELREYGKQEFKGT